MIPAAAWRAPSIGPKIGPGPHRLLLALWDHDHRWRPGHGTGFAFPSHDALAAKLGVARSTVYRGLVELERAGWIRAGRSPELGRQGWHLLTEPTAQRDALPEAATAGAGEQLALTWGADDEPAAKNTSAAPSLPPPPASDPNLRIVASEGSESPPLQGTEVKHHDDDASRIWARYERERVAQLGAYGAAPLRSGPPPRAMHALAASLGGDWSAVERYGLTAIELAAAWCARGLDLAAPAVAWRADGLEWTRKRYDRTMAKADASRGAVLPAAPMRRIEIPAADPTVDGERVDRFERDAWESGGADAVRAMRAAAMDAGALANAAAGFLRQLGACASGGA